MLLQPQVPGSSTSYASQIEVPGLDLRTGRSAGRLWPELAQLECAHDISHATLWSFMNFAGRPSYNPALLVEFHRWQRNIARLKHETGNALKYVVLGSRYPAVFCFGGDLVHFLDCITHGDRQALVDYGLSCVQILHNNWKALGCDITTIGLAQGDALGGGFESLLSFDVVCAEKGTKFGFPEQLFGLFPGMGALSFLGRKLGFAKAEWFVRTGKTVTAEELYELGLVHILAEPGKGIEAVQQYIHKNSPRHGAQLQMHRAAKRANPIPFEELSDIVGLWADACMQLEHHHLQVMRRLVGAQSKLGKVA
ncbi:crotonase/enoyl-CoA hydratase family protein [uncultured Devosia sp.]|uniref:crotonase/enoyl-CoA hydratase family protein n=1 Tax=uncultured Devosia sp. TaxID=211434 RepID=UPI0035C9438D